MTEPVEVAAPPAPRVYKVHNYIDEVKLKADITYTLTNLSDGMQTQAGMIVHYATLAAKSSRQVDDLKLVLEATESVVYRKLRDEALKVGDKVTEVQLAKSVSASRQILGIKRALNEAKQIESIAKGAVEGFKHRRDMLVQEGAYSREEMKGEVRIRTIADSNAAHDAVKQRLLDRLTSEAP